MCALAGSPDSGAKGFGRVSMEAVDEAASAFCTLSSPLAPKSSDEARRIPAVDPTSMLFGRAMTDLRVGNKNLGDV